MTYVHENPDVRLIREALEKVDPWPNAALARLEARSAEADKERERFHRHVEEMIKPKLLARIAEVERGREYERTIARMNADSGNEWKVRAYVLEGALRESDSLIRLLRPDLSHTRPRADRAVEANRAALTNEPWKWLAAMTWDEYAEVLTRGWVYATEEPYADVPGAGQRGCG